MPRDVVAIIALAIELASPGGAAGQTVSDTGGAIAGRVTDQMTAAMPGVTVVISSAGLMGTNEATTGPDGSYRFTALPPNQYTLVFSRAGFQTVKHTAVRVSVGVTTPLDAVMKIAGVEQEITVPGAGVLDRQSPGHTFNFDTPHLANIPGPRTMNTILSTLPAVQLTRPDVGGSAGLIAGPTVTYGTGPTPPTLEGVVIANVNPYGLTLDYGSFQEIAVTTAAHAVDLETAGTRFQFVAKSGGNQYHGSFYADYEDRRWQAWSLMAGFAKTWSRDHAAGYTGQSVRQNLYPLTPNDLINTGDDGRHEFSVWSAKIHGTYHAPWDIRITPFLRHQSGQPFGRTLAVSLSGITRILAEPIGTRRMDHVTIFDLRIEKGFEVPSLGRAAIFVDAYNLLNVNPEQNISWVTGQDFRPLTIVPPRIARIGVRLDW